MSMPKVLVADAVILNKDENGVHRVLLIKRKKEPFKGMYAVPGGKVDEGEVFEDAVRREVEEEVGMKNLHFIPIGSYLSETTCLSVAFLCLANTMVVPGIEKEAVDDVVWMPIDEVPRLAAEHNKMLIDAKRFLKYF